MVLIIGDTTKADDDWVPFEISKAVDQFKIPIIAVYTHKATPIHNPALLKGYWPMALALRINNDTAHVIHIPFKKTVLLAAIQQFSHNNLPSGKGLGCYSDSAYKSFGL
jgi:hypothetical protein